MIDLVGKVAGELSLETPYVANTLKLLNEEDCTIPFIARYRKEQTGSMDEVNIREVRDRFAYLKELEALKAKYIESVTEQAKEKPEIAKKLPTLITAFQCCESKQKLEDLYLPYKLKRRTKAQLAREKGLDKLLEQILEKKHEAVDFEALATPFITSEEEKTKIEDKKLIVENWEAALTGAGDILAEKINETIEVRTAVRKLSHETGQFVSSKIEPKQGEKPNKNFAKYENYFDYKEPIDSAVSHRILAVRRGEAEGCLKANIEVDAEQILADIQGRVLGSDPCHEKVAEWMSQICHNAYKRLLGPSIETEIRVELKKRAEDEAIKVFSQNLENLLLLPPIPNSVVLGVDPGIRTGSKLAAVSANGELIESETIYPLLDKPDAPKTIAAMEVISRFVKTHNVQYIAVGNGTGSREIDQIIIASLKKNKIEGVRRVTVNEAGASVYSTDDIAREEFPDLDPTIRSAISIARRLQDPLAELVKIDPRSIGVGQYQHDCNKHRLERTLGETVESCVNRVGVNLNTASYKLLGYVSGIGPSLAKGIVKHRKSSGSYSDRFALKEVPGFGPKAFEQAAGFLRVPESGNPLDNSAVHPETYPIVEKVVEDLKTDVASIVGKKSLVETISWEKYVDDQVGLPTLLDISSELIKPGRDPREDGARLTFSDEVTTMDDLKLGMTLKGTVSNVTNFGAFVDIGVHQDGLVHISELSDQFVKDPTEVVSVGDVLSVRVIDVDKDKKRISLSCKSDAEVARPSSQPRQQRNNNRAPRPKNGQGQRSGGQGRPSYQSRPQKKGKSRPSQGSEGNSLDDLMNKFNSKA